MPFGADGEHVTVRLVDLEDVERNQYVVSTQYTVRSGANERRADLVLLLLGTPDPDKKSKEIEIKVARRLRRHLHEPRFRAYIRQYY